MLSVTEREILIYVRKKLPNNNSIAEQRSQHFVFTVGIQLKARQTSMGNTSVWIPTLIKGLDSVT